MFNQLIHLDICNTFMIEVKMIYNHHTDTIEEIQPYVQWDVYVENNYGERELLSVWAKSQIDAENNALFDTKIRNASIVDSIKHDDVKRGEIRWITKNITHGHVPMEL